MYCNLIDRIILESAYSLHDIAFVTNLGSILVFAIIVSVLNIYIPITFTLIQYIVLLFAILFLILKHIYCKFKGTFINIALIGPSLYLIELIPIKWLAFPEISFLELMVFGTAISAVDPVSVCIERNLLMIFGINSKYLLRFWPYFKTYR